MSQAFSISIYENMSHFEIEFWCRTGMFIDFTNAEQTSHSRGAATVLSICSVIKHTFAFYLFIVDVLFCLCMCNIIALKQRWKIEAVVVELKAYAQGLPFRILTFTTIVYYL